MAYFYFKNLAVSSKNNFGFSACNQCPTLGMVTNSNLGKWFFISGKSVSRIYLEFPSLYHKAAPGKFGRISSVNNKKQSRVPFYTTTDMSDYQYSFGFFYPLICGITNLMKFDDRNNEVYWKVNPKNLDLSNLDLTQYVELIRMVNFDPQKIGKGVAFYNESESIFEKILE